MTKSEAKQPTKKPQLFSLNISDILEESEPRSNQASLKKILPDSNPGSLKKFEEAHSSSFTNESKVWERMGTAPELGNESLVEPIQIKKKKPPKTKRRSLKHELSRDQSTITIEPEPLVQNSSKTDQDILTISTLDRKFEHFKELNTENEPEQTEKEEKEEEITELEQFRRDTTQLEDWMEKMQNEFNTAQEIPDMKAQKQTVLMLREAFSERRSDFHQILEKAQQLDYDNEFESKWNAISDKMHKKIRILTSKIEAEELSTKLKQ